MIIIDASVAVKWFVPEPGTQDAEALLVSDDVKLVDSLMARAGNPAFGSLLRSRAGRRAGFTLLLCGSRHEHPRDSPLFIRFF
jgi:predicted nucleic acid-binding protein